MKRLTNFAVSIVLAGSLTLLLRSAEKPEISAQIDRGHQLFLASPKGVACATCHFIDGEGRAVGPNLLRLASVVSPRGLMKTIEMTRTVYVQEFRTTDGRTFPAIQTGIADNMVMVWDLTRVPPVPTNLSLGDIVSVRENKTWRHPPASAGYTQQELADIIGFLKYEATGEQREILPDDLSGKDAPVY
jgi:hypothetical protein